MRNLAPRIAVIAILLTVIAAQCPFIYQFNTPELFRTCAESCLNPLYDNCPPQLYIPWPMDQYCGIGTDKIWRNYTYTCEVCNQGAIGYYFGPCTCAEILCPTGYECFGGNCQPIPSCDNVKCLAGTECIRGECVPIILPPQCKANIDCLKGELCDKEKCRPITCSDITCLDPLDTCEYGICFRKYDYFCSKSQPRIERHYCQIDRPNNQECPWYPTVVPQNPANQESTTVCGVNEWNGDLIDFQSQCEACKRTYVSFVYKQPCNTIPIVCKSSSEICSDGWCVPIDKCQNVRCGYGTECNNGICVPICHCQNGYHCQDKVCVPDTPVDPCSVVTCLQGYQCNLGFCYDKCLTTECPSNYQCIKGDCVPISPPVNGCPTQPCAYGWHCESKTHCVKDSVHPPVPDNGYCSTNYDCYAPKVCIGNFCQEMFCDADWRCYGSPCINGKCVNKTPKN